MILALIINVNKKGLEEIQRTLMIFYRFLDFREEEKQLLIVDLNKWNNFQTLSIHLNMKMRQVKIKRNSSYRH